MNSPWILFGRIAEKTPHLALFKPAGQYFPRDLYEAGGVAAIMNELGRHGLIHPECLTVTGKTVGDNIRDRRICDEAVIHPVDRPIILKEELPFFTEPLRLKDRWSNGRRSSRK